MVQHADIDHTGLTGVGGTADHNHTAAGGDGGDLDAPVIDGHAVFNEEAAPATPAAGTVALYAKSDGRIYSMDDAGVETGPFDTAGGGGGPLLYIDTVALHASGDDFPSATLSGWTLAGGLVAGDITQVTTEEYDDECIDIAFGAQGERIYKAVPGSADYEGQFYMWALSGHQYSSSGSGITFLNTGHYATSKFPIVIKLKRVSTTITGSFSINGGVTFKTVTRTDSTTFTRMGIGAMLAAGTLRVGRFNVEEL
jgi:hypothetical protein